MDVNAIPILLAFFWMGFSLAYVILSWIARLKPEFTVVATDFPRLPRVAYPIRLTLALLGLAGCLGVAGFLGQFRDSTQGANAAVLLGFAVGALVAYVLYFRKTPRS